ncbi:hypothetical protein [Celeribacter litoreus]|uniref:hypothetical protein n=1 Tax=Celeribacter litoreus TaxID=2876714 RepID=UPI001CCA2021|nr:hypothetical protein [Celeribacter litoreus]MCA0045106.1 hypothetical protein [Celeribacter litoreus]
MANKHKVKRAFRFSIYTGTAAGPLTLIFYFGATWEIIPMNIAMFLGWVSTGLFAVSFYALLNGVFMPIIGGYLFENVFSESQRDHLRRSKLQRMLLHLDEYE